MRRIVSWLVILTLAWATPVAAASVHDTAAAPPAVPSGPPIGAVVGIGTPDSCTGDTLATAISDLQNLGGGEISFNCGAAPHTIIVSPTLVITSSITIDGGSLGDITLSGNDNWQIFNVRPDAYLALADLVLTAGYLYDGYGGCIGANDGLVSLLRTIVHSCHVGLPLSLDAPGGAPIGQGINPKGGAIGTVGGVTVINESQVLSSTADAGGGIYSTGVLTLINARVAGNAAGGGGGLAVAGVVTIDGSVVEHNEAGTGGGLSTFTIAGLTIRGSRFYSNTASAAGGGVYTQYSLDLSDSTLEDNTAGTEGGGLYVYTGTATLQQLTLIGNTAHTGGGAFLLHGTATFNQAVVDNNHASDGAGITNDGTRTTLTNVTLSHNHASADGGGYYDSGGNGFSAFANVTVSSNTAGSAGGGVKSIEPLTMTNVTIANNVANVGGGFYRTNNLYPYSWRNVMAANNTGNSGPENCNPTTPTIAISSLSSDATCGLGGGLNATLPLGPLALNGGVAGFSMPTHLPLAGSAAINGGTNTGIPLTDQRGAPRPAGGLADVGAVESDAQVAWLWLPGMIR
jgi:hypothetical protein